MGGQKVPPSPIYMRALVEYKVFRGVGAHYIFMATVSD